MTGPALPRLAGAAVAVAVWLAGCTSGAPAAQPGPRPGGVEDPAPAPAPAAPVPPAPPGDDPRLPGPCDPATEAAVAAPVAAQLDALAAGDFVAAYAQASPFFRTVVPQERFEALIRDGYPELLDVAARRLEGCTVLNRRAALVVTVTTTPGARRTLAYELSDTDEGWRIDGAQDMAPPRPAPPDPEV